MRECKHQYNFESYIILKVVVLKFYIIFLVWLFDYFSFLTKFSGHEYHIQNYHFNQYIQLFSLYL